MIVIDKNPSTNPQLVTLLTQKMFYRAQSSLKKQTVSHSRLAKRYYFFVTGRVGRSTYCLTESLKHSWFEIFYMKSIFIDYHCSVTLLCYRFELKLSQEWVAGIGDNTNVTRQPIVSHISGHHIPSVGQEYFFLVSIVQKVSWSQ